MKYIVPVVFLLAIASPASSASFDDHFAVVFIDEATEAKYGSIPLKRNILAQAINALADAGAKGVVLKFFVDLPKDIESDQPLADSMSRLPVILQARIDNSEAYPNKLPKRFTLDIKARTTFEGESGWIPTPLFAKVAHDIGFIDFNGFPLAMLETYKGQTVKSLFLSSIELAVGQKATIEPGSHIKAGHIKVQLDPLNQTAITLNSLPAFQYIPFHNVLESDDWKKSVKNKVVVLGYDGPMIHKIETEQGAVSAHRLFVQLLRAIFHTEPKEAP